MKLCNNLIKSLALLSFVTLLQLQCGKARSLSAVNATESATEVLKSNSTTTTTVTTIATTNKQQNATIVQTIDNNQRINDTNAKTTLPKQSETSAKVSPTTQTGKVVTHIRRKKRELEVTIPYDFNTLHMPCDIDLMGRAQIIEMFPNHCIWVTNNRFMHEGFYRIYKMYQLEAHLFGQYYERLKRYEIDPHFFEYS